MADLPSSDFDSPDPALGPVAKDEVNGRISMITRIVSEVQKRRLSGELVLDEDILSANPNLLPELALDLEMLHRIDEAVRDAKKAGAIAKQPAPDNGNGKSPKSQETGDEPIRISIEGYYLQHAMSRGGQATVFQAVQASTGRKVAIKVIHGGSLVSSDGRARFEREADILAKLNHPNIVSIIDRGRASDGSFFFAMELVEGPTLDEFFESKREEDLPQLALLFATMSEAIDDAHRHGVIHRDLKPSNIRIDARAQPHILDFGLARLLEEDDPQGGSALTITGQVVGSLPWTSPEQAQGLHRQVDARSDVYSLGVMFYQALAGQLPYELKGTFRQVQDIILRMRPVPLSSITDPPLGAIDPSLEAIVACALEKDPCKRYTSAADLARDLRRFAAGKPVDAAVRRRRKIRQPLLLGAAIILPILIAFSAWLVHALASLPSCTNAIGMEFVLIPAGQFEMGSSDDEAGHQPDEIQHRVTFSKSFWFATKEVTNDQYFKVMGTHVGSARFQEANQPVQGLSYQDALEFCKALGERDGNTYTLPTDAQWEYACRAGTARHRFGDGDDLDRVGWHRDNSGGILHPVASKKPNGWGLYDMIGSVREWCLDAPGQYDSSPVRDPIGPIAVQFGIARGGSWGDDPTSCRSAYRSRLGIDHRHPFVGLRLVLVTKGPSATK